MLLESRDIDPMSVPLSAQLRAVSAVRQGAGLRCPDRHRDH